MARTAPHASSVERFVRLIVAGGIALVVGLWLVTVFAAWSMPWLLGLGLVVVGVGGLGAGMWMEVEY